MNQNKNPLVSVIVATYRRNESLKRAISSLLNQTYTNIEILVVDDNANKEWNETVSNIVKEFSNDSRVIYMPNEENLGSAKTRNKGIFSCNGEYITFLDDDDLYMPNKIKNQVEGMIENNADYSLTDLDLYNDDESLSEHRKRPYLINANKENLLKYHLMYHMTGTDTMMFKTDYLRKIGGFDPIDVGDEFYLMQKAILDKGNLYYLPQSQIKAYVHTGEGGLSSGNKKIDGENRLYEFKKQYFKVVNSKTRRYIKMRHFAVLAFAHLRAKQIYKFLLNGFFSFLSSPIQCVKLLINLK